MRRKVVFSPEARADLLALYDYIAEQSSPSRAMGFVERIETYCLGFELGAERGTTRDDLGPRLAHRRLRAAGDDCAHVDRRTVTVDRSSYAGRDVERALRKGD